MITLLYFAWVRERVGTGLEKTELPSGVATIGALIDYLAARDARHEAAFAQRQVVRCAVNQVFASPDAPVADGDEVAFFPPVTGG